MKLSSEFSVVASSATAKIAREIREAIEGVRADAPKFVEQALEIEQKAAQYVADGLSGKIDADIAAEAALRENEALEFLALETKEVQAQKALRRMKSILDISVEAGFALVKVALTLGVAAL